MNPNDTVDRPGDESATRLAGSGDAVTVVGGSTPPRRARSQPPEAGGDAGDGDRGEAPELDADPDDSKDRRPLLLGVVAAVAVVAAAVFAGLYFTSGSSTSGGGSDTQANALRSAANQFANALFTFDANSLNQNISQAQALSTPAYAQTIASFYTADQVAAAKTAQASSRADIKSVFVENISGNSASVFVVLSDTYANNRDPKPRVDQVRMILSYQRIGGAWKVADVQVLQAPPAASAPSTGAGSTPVPSSGAGTPPASS